MVWMPLVSCHICKHVCGGWGLNGTHPQRLEGDETGDKTLRRCDPSPCVCVCVIHPAGLLSPHHPPRSLPLYTYPISLCLPPPIPSQHTEGVSQGPPSPLYILLLPRDHHSQVTLIPAESQVPFPAGGHPKGQKERPVSPVHPQPSLLVGGKRHLGLLEPKRRSPREVLLEK